MRSIEELLESIDVVLDKATNVPFRPGRCTIDGDELKNIIEEFRVNLPQEIRKAKAIVAERKSLLDSAQKQADEIIHKAEERARALVNQEEIYKQALEKAKALATETAEQSADVKKAAVEYSDNALLQTENAISQSLEVIRQARKNLRAAAQADAARKAKQANGGKKDSESDEEE